MIETGGLSLGVQTPEQQTLMDQLNHLGRVMRHPLRFIGPNVWVIAAVVSERNQIMER